MAEKTIEIKDLVVEYRTRSGVVQALNGLSLSIEKGKTLGLVGEVVPLVWCCILLTPTADQELSFHP